MFENYLVAMGGERFSSTRKKALLLHNLGVEGRAVFDGLGSAQAGEAEDTDEYALAIKQLKDHFEPKKKLHSRGTSSFSVRRSPQNPWNRT